MFAVTSTSFAVRSSKQTAPARSRGAALRVRAEDKKPRTGFVDEDNSGRGNIFAVEPAKVYLRSPTRDAAGAEGIGRYFPYVGGAAALVALAVTFNLAGKGPDVVFDGAETLSYYLVQFSK